MLLDVDEGELLAERDLLQSALRGCAVGGESLAAGGSKGDCWTASIILVVVEAWQGTSRLVAEVAVPELALDDVQWHALVQ